MIARILLVLVVGYLLLRVLGQWRALQRQRGGPRVEAARKCPDCGAYVVGAKSEVCARAGCRFR
ncbi:MAG: hypothetical protein U1E40_03640 [Amaricoccus sp.]